MPGDRDPGRRLAVGVVRRKQPLETGVRLAPSRMLEVVAAAVGVPVREVWVANDHLVLLAAGDCVARLARVEVDARQQLRRVRLLEDLRGARVQLVHFRRRWRLSVAELRGLSEQLLARQAQVEAVREAVSGVGD